jgi:hypothetical protein
MEGRYVCSGRGRFRAAAVVAGRGCQASRRWSVQSSVGAHRRIDTGDCAICRARRSKASRRLRSGQWG